MPNLSENKSKSDQMKKYELRRRVAGYKETEIESSRSKNKKLNDELKFIEHQHHHKTGRTLKSDLEGMT